MCPYFSAKGFSNVDWWTSSMQSDFTSHVRPSFCLVLLQVLKEFWHGCISCKSGNFYLRKDACKKPPHEVYLRYMQFTCKTENFTCFYATSTSRCIHAIALNKAHKLQITSLAGHRLTYLQFEAEFTRGVMADCLQLQVTLCVIAGIFACVCSYFCLVMVFLFAILVFLPANCMYFCLQKQAVLHASRGQICMSSVCKITCKIPVVFR